MERQEPIKAKGIQNYIGLMFKSSKRARPMVFEFEKPVHNTIHTLFCNFPIRCIFYDEKNEIIEDVVLEEWTGEHKPPRPFVRLLEIPVKENERRSNETNGFQTTNETKSS